jgi:hypothetical protein
VVRLALIGPGDIGDADGDLLFRRCRVTEPVEPYRGPRGPAAGVDHQIGVQPFGGAVPRCHQHADDPAPVGRAEQVGRLRGTMEADVRQSPYPRPDRVFQQGPADADSDDFRRRAVHAIAVVEPMHLVVQVDERGAAGVQLLAEALEQLVQRSAPAGEQDVQLARLRHPAPRHGRVGQRVTVDDRDGLVRLAQHPGGDQTRHAGAEHHRVLLTTHACDGR